MVQQDRENENSGSLESIGDILKRQTGAEAGQGGKMPQPANQSLPRKEIRREECECNSCGNKFQGEVMILNNFQPPREYRDKECPDCKSKRDEVEKQHQDEEEEARRMGLRVKWHRECGLPIQLRNIHFSNLDKKYNPNPQKLCREWVDSFELENPAGSPSLVLYSAVPGVGKTTLMVCIVNAVLEKWKGSTSSKSCPIRFISGPELVKRIRATYGIRKDDSVHEREEDVYRELNGIKLLLFDDVGKERPSDFTRETYWYIINERMNAGLPVVLNSRLPITGGNSLSDLMGVDTADRLYGMAEGKYVNLEGPSYRWLHKTP